MAFVLLVPYNDSMHLGQGFNSFLQEPCIDGAVKISEGSVQTQAARSGGSSNVSQVVSYSSRFVEKISDVVRSMNISAASSIKSGTIQVSGNSMSVDEIKFAASDINAVISVKVINRKLNQLFVELDKGIKLTSEQFFQLYGDCYISGRVSSLDTTQDDIVLMVYPHSLKSAMNGATGDFVLSEGSASSSLEAWVSQTESTVTVNWSGGGQIKPDEDEWTLESLIRAASSFPSRVAACPQRTFAILTPYTRNRDFVKWAIPQNIVVPDFTKIQYITHDLLDNYMLYKSNLAKLQAAISDPTGFRVSQYSNAINLNINVLLDERKSLKLEMAKITGAIDRFNKDPSGTVVEDFESPEIWATRLPVPTDQGDTRLISQKDIDSIISGFSFVDVVPETTPTALDDSLGKKTPGQKDGEAPVRNQPAVSKTQDPTGTLVRGTSPSVTASDTLTAQLEAEMKKKQQEAEKKQQDLEKARPPPPPEPPLVDLYRSSALLQFKPKDLEFLKSDANRRKYAKYRFEAPVGSEGGGRFNDAEVLENSPAIPPTWPKTVKLLMRAWNDEYLLSQVQVVYQHHNLTWGGAGTVVKTIPIDLSDDERINRVVFGRGSAEKGIQGVSYVEVQTTSGRVFKGGNQENAQMQIFEPFGGAIGLKGFWGMRGDVLDMIGPIWGLS
ncbi:hypothetical protein BKA56DRAFT_685543 [Ilyonectria sp. MPI-CAGE-AT-0026]|nr:hypothetical protein BKA56DRAFT_685543 [Ilyonectria sp. MPI-CAGE-AT-0026]